MQPTDADLIQRSLTDAEAFGELYDRHHRALRAWAAHKTGSADVAGDIVAETFAQAFASRRRFRPVPSGSALPWLFGIAHNLVRRFRRARRVDTAARARLGIPLDLTVGADVEAEDGLELAALASELREGLASLPEGQRHALALRYGDDLPFAQLAAELGITPGNARVRVTRALASLRLTVKERTT